jgi:hypothetical protein
MNQIFTHPDQPQMQAEVILASRNMSAPDDHPLVTIRLRYPRIIHGEIMTHRVFSRNARSSRAVPVRTMLNEVRNTPFIPWHWGKNQKGMQADEECNAPVALDMNGGGFSDGPSREEAWLWARDQAVAAAAGYMTSGYHKQIPNRLLEPFSWIDTLITSNDWANFLWLRDHKDAEPHLQDLARLVKQALETMDVQELQPGDWHLPYITEKDWDKLDDRHKDLGLSSSRNHLNKELNKISAARCARISYMPFDGDASYERELERYDLLVSSDRVHASPTEHQATPDEYSVEYCSWDHPEFHGNLPGWVQARKLIPNERHTGELS